MTLPNHCKIFLPTNELRSNYASFQALNTIHQSLSSIHNSQVEIDCSSLNWMDAQLSSPFRAIIEHSARQGNVISLSNLKSKVELILQKNGLLANTVKDTYNTTMPVVAFDLNEAVSFANYAKKYLNHPAMPKMTAALQMKFFEGVDELFANCELHSKSSIPVIVAGQFFPTHKKLSISISDGGIGMTGSLSNAGYTFPTHEDAIEWAMNNDNTSRHGYIPGGLGLKVLREFVRLNGGQLIIASHGGYWSDSSTGTHKKNFKNLFPGTSVVLEINTADTKKYDLAKKQDPNNIW